MLHSVLCSTSKLIVSTLTYHFVLRFASVANQVSFWSTCVFEQSQMPLPFSQCKTNLILPVINKLSGSLHFSAIACLQQLHTTTLMESPWCLASGNEGNEHQQENLLEEHWGNGKFPLNGVWHSIAQIFSSANDRSLRDRHLNRCAHTFRPLSTRRLSCAVDLYKWPCAPSTHHLYTTFHLQSRPAKPMRHLSSRIAHAPVTSTEHSSSRISVNSAASRGQIPDPGQS